MDISVYASSNHLRATDVKNKTAVVVDMLRASSTIVTALNNGAADVAPMQSVEDAMAVKHSNRDIVLGGEKNSIKIMGFDLGNSPLEYTKEAINGKNIVLCTYNGAKAIFIAAHSKRVIIGALINVTAVAKKLVDQEGDVVIVCAGTDGKFSIDDIVTAGAIINRVKEMGVSVKLDDLGILCQSIYAANRNDLHALMKGSKHYTYLASLGYDSDLEYCLTEDKIDFAPECVDGSIRRN